VTATRWAVRGYFWNNQPKWRGKRPPPRRRAPGSEIAKPLRRRHNKRSEIVKPLRRRRRWTTNQLATGDVVMVTRLDRLARSTRDLLNTLATITEKKAGFRSLADTWADTTTPHGRLMLTVLGGLAEFEKELILARTNEGRARAKERGGEARPETQIYRTPEARGDPPVCGLSARTSKTVRNCGDRQKAPGQPLQVTVIVLAADEIGLGDVGAELADLVVEAP
jgi:hypothetical protein